NKSPKRERGEDRIQESKIRSSDSAIRNASSTLGRKCDKPPDCSTIPLRSNMPKTPRLARRQKKTLAPASAYDFTISNKTCVPDPSILVTPWTSKMMFLLCSGSRIRGREGCVWVEP